MYRRNSVILRERMVNHVREGIDRHEHLPTQNNYIDYINRYKHSFNVKTAREVGLILSQAGRFLNHTIGMRYLLEEVHETENLPFDVIELENYYNFLIGQAFRDIEKDRFPLEGDTP